MCIGLLTLAAGGLVLASGCVVEPDGRVYVRPIVVAPAPAPVYVAPAPEPVLVPDSYVWDGYEYVGVVGGQYYYLGAGNVWFVCEPFRLERFHGWEGRNPGWRDHAVRNDRFRYDAHGHVQPRHDAPKKRDDRDRH